MIRTCVAAVALAALVTSPAFAQDAKTIVSNSSKAMGAENLNSITYYGSGAKLQPWPVEQCERSVAAGEPERLPAVDRLYRTRRPALVGGYVSACPSPAVRQRRARSTRSLHPPTTPGPSNSRFGSARGDSLKGAAANNATAASQTIGGKRYSVVTMDVANRVARRRSLIKVVGHINSSESLVEQSRYLAGEPDLSATCSSRRPTATTGTPTA